MQESIQTDQPKSAEDKIEVSLRNISQNIIAVVFGLLPLFFIPISYAPFGYTKTLFVIVGVLGAIIFYSLSVLRSGKLQITTPIALFGFWGVALVTLLSAVLSGDMRDTLIGDNVNVHTASFVLLLALVATVTAILGQTKASIMRLYILLTGSAVVLALFHVFRIILGSDVLTFGVFGGSAASPIGGWNDLGLFFGLSILLSLVALEQLPLTKWGRVLFSTVVALSLLMLAIVNFFSVWIVLALVSLVVLMYSLTKDRFTIKTLTMQKESTISMQSVLLSTSVFVVSLLFIIGGSGVGSFVSEVTKVSYVEVRPSFEATVDIARNVYSENAFVGIGPNKFVDAWRLYKDPAINQTIFWSTNFNAGNGYITTLFVTTGIFGVLAWVLFLALFLIAGFRMLFKTVHADRFWYFIGSSAFVAALYLWVMSFIYVPGSAILLLAAMFTSVTFAAYSALVSARTRSFTLSTDRRSGFVLVGIVMVVIIASASALYYTGRHYASVYAFGEAVASIQTGTVIEEVEQKIAAAYTVSQNDMFARRIAEYQLARMNTLLTVPEPNAQQQQQFQNAAANGINAAQLAVNSDPTESQNWAMLGSIYSILASAGIEGAMERAQEAFGKAQEYDPVNPSYILSEAQLYSRVGNLPEARRLAVEAIRLKSNYTEALFFITQIEIAEGNVTQAIATTRAIVSLEPRNPARWYQLGILESSQNNLPGAITAFEQAIQLDTNYANARYFLALAYVQGGRNDEAVAQLSRVLELNPGNPDVISLIQQIQSGEVFQDESFAPVEQIDEPETVTESETDDSVTTTVDPDTPLISTVNPVGASQDEEQSESADQDSEEQVTPETE